LPGGESLTVQPVILEADEPRELRWLWAKGFSGICDTEQCFTLVPKGENRTHVIHRITCTGLALSLPGIGAATTRGSNQLPSGARGDEPRPQVSRAGRQRTRAVTEGRRVRIIGYLCALGAGATWGTTGPLSTGLYGLMPATNIGFWRVLIGTIALVLWGFFFRRELFRVDARGWLLVGLGGGALVALFEIAYQFAIAGVGVAGAAALLYTAPVIVAVFARVILKEALTPLRIALALIVMVGVALTVTGGSNAGAEAARTGNRRRYRGRPTVGAELCVHDLDGAVRRASLRRGQGALPRSGGPAS